MGKLLAIRKKEKLEERIAHRRNKKKKNRSNISIQSERIELHIEAGPSDPHKKHTHIPRDIYGEIGRVVQSISPSGRLYNKDDVNLIRQRPTDSTAGPPSGG
jgi:hypothetical protein